MLNMLDAHGVVNSSCAGEGTQKFVDTDEHKLQLVVMLAGIEGVLHHKNGSQKREIRFYAKVSMVGLEKKMRSSLVIHVELTRLLMKADEQVGSHDGIIVTILTLSFLQILA